MKGTFRTVPEFVRELEQARADGARQMFAALFITTIEDAKAVFAGGLVEGTPEGLLEWAVSMKAEIDRGGFRQDFIKLLASDGFHMNTHPGFALSMMSSPSVTRDQVQGLQAFEAACLEYAQGEREEPPTEEFLPDCPEAIERECNLLRIMSHMNRLVREGKE